MSVYLHAGTDDDLNARRPYSLSRASIKNCLVLDVSKILTIQIIVVPPTYLEAQLLHFGLAWRNECAFIRIMRSLAVVNSGGCLAAAT